MSQSFFKKIFNFLEKLRWKILVAAGSLLILFVVMVGLLRLALPFLSDYQEDIEQYLSQELQRDIKVKQIDVGWHWFSPNLKLIDVKVADKKGTATFIQFDEVSFEFGLIDNLVNLSFEPTVITLSGGVVLLKKDKNGEFYLQSQPLGIKSVQGANSSSSLDKFAAQLKNKEIHMTDMEVHWTDMSRSKSALFIKKVNVVVKVLENKFQILAEAKTPEQIAKYLMVKADIRRDQKVDERGINIYINADQIKSDYIYHYIPDPGVKIKTVVDTEVWLRLKGNSLKELSGHISADEMNIFASERKAGRHWQAKKLSMKFHVSHKQDEWALTLDKLNMSLGEHEWKNVYLTSMINTKTNALRLRSDALYLDDVTDLISQLPVANKIKQTIRKYSPVGVLKKTNIVINDWEEIDDWIFKTEFEKFGISLESGHIDIKGISGSLILDKNSGELRLNSQDVGFKSDYFNKPVNIDSLKTNIKIAKFNGIREIESEKIKAVVDGVKVQARFKYLMNAEKHLDLQLSSKGFSAEWFKKHRTDYFLGKETSNWLDTAVRQASVENLNLVIHGSLNELPFKSNNGVLQANFDIKNGVLKYVQGWPQVKELSAKFFYDNDIIKISDSTGKIFSSDIKDAVTTIDLRKEPHVIIDGKVKTTAAELGRFFNASPLSESYQKITSAANLSADLNAILHIDVPLVDKPVVVSGDTEVAGGVLKVKTPGYIVTDLKGKVRFKNTDISATDLSGKFDGRPVDASITTAAFKNTMLTTVDARFHSDLSALLPFDLPLDKISEQKADWGMRLELLHEAMPADPALSVNISSDLKGLALKLPVPLKKESDESVDIKVDYKSFADYSDLMVHCKTKINLHMQWHNGFSKLRSDIRILDGDVQELKPGLNISARSDQVDLVQWKNLLELFQNDHPGSDEMAINSLALETAKLSYGEYQLNNVNLKTKADAVKLIFGVAADEFNGEVAVYPSFSRDKPVEIDFTKLRLSELMPQQAENKKDKLQQKMISPVLIPPLKINGKDLSYKDYHFDSVNLETSRSRFGMTVHSLGLKSDNLAVKLKGTWFIKQDNHQSTFRIELASENVGGMLSAYKLTKSMKKGEGHGVINWQWPASPFDFDWKLVSGSMQMELSDGRFVDIEPGAGRLLGMFSLSSLPKRFLLDFSDTFSEGFEFSKLESQGNFIDGSLYTSKTVISGSSADIYFNGRIGLADRDYDQIMSVVPRISSGVSGWIAVLQGAAVGLTAYLGQKLLGVDEAAKNQYHITGTWKDPVIKKIGDDKKEKVQVEKKEMQESEGD